MKTERFEVTYKDEKYDIGDFLSRHPGGTDVLLPYKGKDITIAFNHIGHSNDAKYLLRKRLIKNHKSEKSSVNDDSTESGANSNSQSNISSDIEIDNKKFIVKKLFTEEDKFNAHKILGFLALISYAYRYFYVLPKTGKLGITHDWFSYLTLALHMLLSCSSFIFHVLTFRIIENPLIIYEEYRLHAIVFTFRGIYVAVLGLCIDYVPLNLRLIALISGIAFVHLLTDLITYKYGKPGVTAVRINEARREENKLVADARYIYSYYQFAAIGSHLSVDTELPDLGFNVLIAIQSSAFLMTLKRKNLIEWYSHAFWYSLALVLSLYYMYLVKGGQFFLYVVFVFIARTIFNLNKYLLWFIYAICVNNSEYLLELMEKVH